MMLRGKVLIDGVGVGPLLRLSKPISFWGGVDPVTGRITDPRHPDHGTCVSGTVLALTETIGSSSSSAIMLELLSKGLAPCVLLMGRPDAILTLGVVVAREMGMGSIPVLQVDVNKIPAVSTAVIKEGGEIFFSD
ncbi:MAG: DUF126 domain-containing protein [Pseudomonadota bacterium]|nr:DUF126 domain-containing protein [Pseudomonadota bacterium]